MDEMYAAVRKSNPSWYFMDAMAIFWTTKKQTTVKLHGNKIKNDYIPFAKFYLLSLLIQ